MIAVLGTGTGRTTVNSTLAGVWSVFPAPRLARTVNEWRPRLSAEAGRNGLSHPVQAPESIWHSKVAWAWSELNEKLGRVSVVVLPGHAVIAVSGTGTGGTTAVKLPLRRVRPLLRL